MAVPKPVVLCILDGWGLREDPTANAPALADTPTYDRIMADGPHSRLITHGPDVGLPTGQMGNSEVGHTNIGAGRVVAMDLGQIDLAIEDGSFFGNEAILSICDSVKAAGGRLHLMGVVSDGGVHGHISHILAAARLAVDRGVEVLIHAITDGRDVAPSSAADFMAALVAGLPAGARVATVIGRYWAMDRDNRWDRVERAYRAMVAAQGEAAADALAAVTAAYARGETDEFIAPSVVGDYAGARDGDGFFCLNFRADRAREILAAIGAPDFKDFDTGARPKWSGLLGMVQYSDAHAKYMTAAYPKRDIVNTLGSWVAQHGLRQFRLAETEKYPHVTFFLNGGKEAPEVGEDRFMPKSPKVATYDLQPEMSSVEVTDKFVEAIGAGYDLIVVNYANPDMVGHTGDLGAAIKACEAVDRGLARVVEALGKGRGRDDRDRRSRQLRGDGRPGDRRAAYRAYHEPGAGGPGRRACGCAPARRAAFGPCADAAGPDGPAAAARDDRQIADRDVNRVRAALAVLALGCALAGPARLAAADTAAAQTAQAAAVALREAIEGLDQAQSASERIAALTATIRAYEDGLQGLRDGQRRAALREAEIAATFDERQARLSQALGAMMVLEQSPGPLVLLHPQGPEAAVRSGMVLSDATPALRAEADVLRADLEEVAQLRSLQAGAAASLQAGLASVQGAREKLSQAIQDRTDLPQRYLEDPEELRALVQGADTLDGFASGLIGLETDVGAPMEDFTEAKGRLALPAAAQVLRRVDEPDAAGIRRPGVVLQTLPGAIVTAPWPATIRYRGPLLDYENVMIVEPATGYLLILGGLGTVFGETGDVVPEGAALGLMQGNAGREFAAGPAGQAAQVGDAGRAETLYMELRQGTEPLNPEEWFAALAPE